MKLLKNIFIAAALMALSAQAAVAATFVAGETGFVQEAVDDDLYVVAGKSEINADVNGDLYMFAGQAVVNGDIAEDLVITGGQINIVGDVKGDLRILGGEVSIFGTVGDDLLVTGGTVDLGRDAVVEGSVFASSGILTLSGDVREDVKGATGMLTILGNVGGNVQMTVQDTLKVDHLASVGGNLEYSSFIAVDVPEGVVAGDVVFNKFDRKAFLGELTAAYFYWKLIGFASALLIVLLVAIAVPRYIVKTNKNMRAHTWKSMGVGALTIVIGFMAPLMLFFTIIGVPLGLVILFSLGIVWILAKVFAAAYIGSFIVDINSLKKPESSNGKIFWAMSLGLLIYYVIGIIPVIGWIANALLFLIGVGGMVKSEIQYLDFLRSKKKI